MVEEYSRRGLLLHGGQGAEREREDGLGVSVLCRATLQKTTSLSAYYLIVVPLLVKSTMCREPSLHMWAFRGM